MSKDKNHLLAMRHSAAHLMAAAVKSLWPETKFGIGPVIENGFYYDFELPLKLTEEDLAKIEKKMQALKDANLPIRQQNVSIDEALKREKKNAQIYKVELLEQIKKTGDTRVDHAEIKREKGHPKKIDKVSYYKLGDFEDLCRGPHLGSTKEIGYFKLLNIAGAYWRGSEKNPMLTRIYGTAWSTKDDLNRHLAQLEEIKKRDHRKIGPALELFMFHETAPGMPYWLPKGLVILNELIKFWRIEHSKRGYQEISTPLINKKKLWEISGHWGHYRSDMFIADMGKEEVYGLKPMNCPNAMIVFGSKTRSYRDLPLRLSDTDPLHRYERSGTLSGLFRVRSFRQDDSHNFITEEQIGDEYQKIFEIADLFYGVFDLEFSLRLGTRPEKYLGDKKTWDKAEATLKKILEASGKEYFVLEGDGAFYGPKVDILMKDALDREWQMGTIQLDFQQPRRFKLKYIDQKGREITPVVIHRVIYGSLERFIGILIEHFDGAFPVWLSPVQVKVLPVSAKNIKYAMSLTKDLEQENIRFDVDERNETLPAKIRDAQLEKVPYMLVIGDKEEKSRKVSVRLRTEKDLGQMSLAKFLERIRQKVANKSLDL